MLSENDKQFTIEAVERGAKLLDEKVPDWRHRIKRTLDMSSCFECVLGQIFGTYDEGCRELKFGTALNPRFDNGFNGHWHSSRQEGYELLKTLWENKISNTNKKEI